MLEDLSVRMATNEDGAVISALVASTGFEEDYIDWTVIYPYWLVAEHEGKIVGTVQICPSRPIGRLEFLVTVPDLSHRLKAITVKRLLVTGVETLKLNGAQLVSGVVSFEMKSFKKMLKRRGAITALSGNLMVWRV